MSEDAPQGEIPKPEESEHQQAVETQSVIPEGVHIPISEHVETPATGDVTNEVQEHTNDDSATKQTYIPDTYVNNVEKAEVMAHVQNDAVDAGEKFPQTAALRAGIEYDKDFAKNKTRGYEPDKAGKEEAVNTLANYNVIKRNQVVRYSNAIVEHYKEHGDKPTPALEALAAVHKLVHYMRIEDFEIDTNGDFFAIDSVRVTLDKHERVIVECGDWQKNKSEKFTLSMFNGASYEVTEETHDGREGDFDEELTIKRRRLEPKDVKRLEEVLAPAIAYQEEQKRLNDEAQKDWDDEEDERLSVDSEQGRDDEEDDYVSTQEIARRARAHFGDTELAREAAEMYPGDFM